MNTRQPKKAFHHSRVQTAMKLNEKKSNEDLSRGSKIHTSSVMETLTNFVWCFKKLFAHKNTWMTDKDSFRHCYLQVSLSMESITDINYEHAKRVRDNFGLHSLGQYHDSSVQSDTLLLADVFEIFRNKWFEIYELDPVHVLSAPELVW